MVFAKEGIFSSILICADCIEAVLLWIGLCKRHSELQKMLAFQNGFETLFDIVREEGFLDGDIVVADSLKLMHHLLDFNVSNQVLRRLDSCWY